VEGRSTSCTTRRTTLSGDYLPSEDAVHAVRGPLERGGRQVGVHVRRRREVRVAEDAADDAQFLAILEQEGGTGVAQIVKALSGQASSLDGRLERVGHVPGAQRLAEGRGKDKIVVMPSPAGSDPFS
jgi:hypothetical protein